MSQFTKKAIIQTFLQLLEKESMDKITVKDIVDSCGINRNTFYYYYRDIYDLIDDIFESEKQRILADKKQYENWSDEIYNVAQIVFEYKKAISHIYYSKSRDVLEKYLFDSMELIIHNYVKENIDATGISDENIHFVCSFFSYSLVGLTLNWVREGMQTDSENILRKEASVFENTIRSAIEGFRIGKR